MSDDPLLPEEEARLAASRVPIAPPVGAEDRLVTALRQRGLLRPRYRTAALAWTVAASVALIAAVLAMFWLRPVQPAPTGPRYMLLLYGGTDPVQGAADRREEYAEWARGIASSGVAISGEELAPESRSVGAAPAGSDDPPRGFFILSVPDLESAERIASTCPHLRYGGRIVIRRVAGS